MKTEVEIREQIKKITDGYRHVLDCRLANMLTNAPRALMQIEGIAKLDSLYWSLGETRPRFKYDERT